MKHKIFMLSFAISFIFIAFNTNAKSIKLSQINDTLFKVIKIETLKHSYVLHLKHNKVLYKIVSLKDNESEAKGYNKIKKGKSYYFSINPFMYVEQKLGDTVFRNPYNVTCMGYLEDSICIEKSSKYVRELFFIKDLKGLYIKNR